MLGTFILSLERVIMITLKGYFGVRSKERRYPGEDNCPRKEYPHRGSMDVGDQLSMRGDTVAQRNKEMVPFDTRNGTPDTAG